MFPCRKGGVCARLHQSRKKAVFAPFSYSRLSGSLGGGGKRPHHPDPFEYFLIFTFFRLFSIGESVIDVVTFVLFLLQDMYSEKAWKNCCFPAGVLMAHRWLFLGVICTLARTGYNGGDIKTKA